MRFFLYLIIVVSLSCSTKNVQGQEGKGQILQSWRESCYKELNRIKVADKYQFWVNNFINGINNVKQADFNTLYDSLIGNKEQKFVIAFFTIQTEAGTDIFSLIDNSYSNPRYFSLDYSSQKVYFSEITDASEVLKEVEEFYEFEREEVKVPENLIVISKYYEGSFHTKANYLINSPLCNSIRETLSVSHR